MQALIGVKKVQSQRFLENGMRIPVTLIDVKGNCVIAHRTNDKNHYQAVQLGFGIRKHATKAQIGHAKGTKLEKAPKFLKEVRILDDSPLPEVGSVLNPSEVFTPGDIVNVSGISKGKGFAGVVKRHGFHGGPKTHGQSDRHRAPGAIGQGTTPGRVYKGKRMAGRMGNENVTIRNLKVVDVTADGVLVIRGLVPGIINGPIMVKKVGEDKKFVPLWKEVLEGDEESLVESSEAEALRSPQQLDESSDASTPASDVPSDSGHGQASPDSNEDSSRAEAPRASEEGSENPAATASNAASRSLAETPADAPADAKALAGKKAMAGRQNETESQKEGAKDAK